MIHSDLHEPKVPRAFECLSTMVACVEPALVDPVCGESPGNLSVLEQNYSKAKFIVRLKRRNGRVKHLVRLPAAPVFLFFSLLLNSIEESRLIFGTNPTCAVRGPVY